MWRVTDTVPDLVTDTSSGYGRFGPLSRVELERESHLDDQDRALRGPAAGLQPLGFEI